MTPLPIDRSPQAARLSRTEGQLRGVRRMISDGRYCLDIATQIEAVIGALHRIQWELVNATVRAAARESRRRHDAAPLELFITDVLRAIAGNDMAGHSAGVLGERRSGSSVCCSDKVPQSRR